jgi:hypothetical protein
MLPLAILDSPWIAWYCKDITQFLVLHPWLQQQFLEHRLQTAKACCFGRKWSACKETSAKIHLQACLPSSHFNHQPLLLSQPPIFHLGIFLSFLGYNSKICTGSQGAFKISSFTDPGALGDSTFLEGPGASAAHPQAHTLAWPPLLTQSQGQGSLHFRPTFPDLPISQTIKLPNENIPITS